MDELRKIITEKCPDLKIESLEFLGEGDFCRAFLVNRTRVFRFAKHDEARRSLSREACLLPKISRSLSLKIPQPDIVSFDGAATESFIVYPFLPDRALTQVEYLRLDENGRSRCARQTALFLNDLHETNLVTARDCGVRQIDYSEKFTHLLDRWNEKMFGLIERADFTFAAAEIEKFLSSPELKSLKPVLLHGDFSPDHVLYDGENVTAVIDFGDVVIGDRAADFLWIYEDYGIDFLTRVLECYRLPDKNALRRRITLQALFSTMEWTLENFETNDVSWKEAAAEITKFRRQPNLIRRAY